MCGARAATHAYAAMATQRRYALAIDARTAAAAQVLA
jgi:hypothetical protein